MIFVTVGVQLPFDRLIRAMDEWAHAHPATEVIAQTGATAMECRYMHAIARADGQDFQRIVDRAELVVAHAGMGSILTALEIGKPIIVLPRSAELGEHRNDHQMATSQHMRKAQLVRVAKDADELKAMVDERHCIAPRTISKQAQPQLIETVRQFIQTGKKAGVTGREQMSGHAKGNLEGRVGENAV